jgi:hypothetical protein
MSGSEGSVGRRCVPSPARMFPTSSRKSATHGTSPQQSDEHLKASVSATALPGPARVVLGISSMFCKDAQRYSEHANFGNVTSKVVQRSERTGHTNSGTQTKIKHEILRLRRWSVLWFSFSSHHVYRRVHQKVRRASHVLNTYQ